MKRSGLRVAASVLMVKDRIQQFYVQAAALEKGLNEYKTKHGYCVGRPFCMNLVPERADGRIVACAECLKANANPKYAKRTSAYGKIRARERAEERERKAKEEKPAKKTATKPRKAAA